ncbi:phage major capsid protein [Streptomyces sp. ME02-6979.5a]|uniref:phage major capsid protein n=1 Tax=unclassified Streptomyces TaxID=2593676 RepID=UPI00299FE00D|nr:MULTISPECIES: phage major capsid protein [unclassified Streptomyces]MDX3343704.1 phage major capsid protein [Streptomyces sp. ME02-6979.5a]MDX5526218.1 phage major capsid protein [Streptomyces sp. DE06-01C]
MPNLKSLLDQRATAWNQAQEFHSRGDDKPLSDEDRSAWDAALADVERLSTEIETEERHARLAAVDYSQVVPAEKAPETGEDRQASQEAAYRDAFSAFTRRGMSGLDNEQRQLLMSNQTEIRAGATSPGSAGGYFIPTDTLAKITETMKAYGGLLGAANVITTASGNPLNWPTNDDTSNVGAILAENAQITEQDVTLGQKTLGAYMYTSKLVRLSLQLIQDDAFGVESWLARKLGERIGRAVAAHLATGTGSSQPEGLFTNATAGKTGASGQVTSVLYDDLIDLQHSIDPAYRTSAQWAMSDSALKVVRKLKDGDGRPLWEPSTQVGVPSSLLGAPVLIDNGIPVPAASAKSIGYGDINAAYVVRQVSGGQLMRLDERYADYLQVGFFGFMRLDAKPDDASAFKVYAHPAT